MNAKSFLYFFFQLLIFSSFAQSESHILDSLTGSYSGRVQYRFLDCINFNLAGKITFKELQGDFIELKLKAFFKKTKTLLIKRSTLSNLPQNPIKFTLKETIQTHLRQTEVETTATIELNDGKLSKITVYELDEEDPFRYPYLIKIDQIQKKKLTTQEKSLFHNF